MTELTLRAYDPQDFLAIEVDEYVRQAQENQPVEQWATYHKTHGPAITIVDPEERIVVCVGVRHLWEGVGEIWMVFSPLAAKYPRTVSFLRTMIAYLQEVMGYHRLQATIDTSWAAAIRFVEHMGFIKEAVMKRYGPNGADHALYALIQEVPND